MKLGVSLHIGVNHPDPNSFPSVRHPRLRCAQNDARAMRDIARRNGFTVLGTLLGRHATFRAVEHGIRDAARRLRNGGVFMLSYSGHGMHLSRGDDNDNGYDEGFLLHDLGMKDDYIDVLLRLFPSNAYIIFVCDSCHSCSIEEFFSSKRHPRPERHVPHRGRKHSPDAKFLNQRISDIHCRQRRSRYEKLDIRFETERKEKREAHLLVLAACDEASEAFEGPTHGRFTQALLEILCCEGEPGASYTGSYDDFMVKVEHYMEPDHNSRERLQTPCFKKLGFGTMHRFLQGPPFTLFEVGS